MFTSCFFFVMNYRIRYLDSTQSTNDDARKWAENRGRHGESVVAAYQSAGRGRLGRVWHSPPGKNLYCSIIVRPEIEPADYPRLTLVAGLGVAEYLESICKVEVGLKWPNDLFIKGRKCGGILCESSLTGNIPGSNFAIIGIGLNVNLVAGEIPSELIEKATSLLIEGCTGLHPVQLFPGIRDSILDLITQYECQGFSRLLKRWKKRDVLCGKQMAWLNSDGNVVTGKSLGPDDSGILHVVDSEGKQHQVVSGDVQVVLEK